MAVPAVIKAKYIMSGPDHGWQEVHFFEQTSNSLDSAIAAFLRTVPTRRVLLGAENRIKAVECSIETDTNGQPVTQDGAASTIKPAARGLQSEPSADLDLAVVIKQSIDTRTKRRNTFLRGFWDGVESEGGDYKSDYGTWESKLQAWISDLRALRTGWLHRVRSADYPITGYTQTDDGRVLITFGGTGPFGPGPYPQRLQMGINTNRQASVLKGMQILAPQSATTALTVNRIAVFPYTGANWKANKFTYEFVPIAFWDAYRIARRGTGRPLLVSPGRQRAAARG